MTNQSAELREAIARVITPVAGWENPSQSWMSSARADALDKADAILALLPPQGREVIRNAALEEAAAAAEQYGEVTFESCGDNILMDPLLHGEPWTEANVKLSAECQVRSTIHSAGFHAANHIAENIRVLKSPAILKGQS